MQIDRNTIQQYATFELLAKEVVHGFITGLHKSPFHGFSVEFAEHRQYNKGESTKHIDWKLFGRTDRLYIKQYEEETNLRCLFLIDQSPSMYYPENNTFLDKVSYASLLCASLMEILRRQRDVYGLGIFDEDLLFTSELKSTTAHFSFLLEQLQNLSFQKPVERNFSTPLVDVLHNMAESMPKRSMIVICTDFYRNNKDTQALFDALAHLKHRKHEVLLFHMLEEETEQNLNLSNREHIFLDAETGESVKAYPHQIQQNYIAEQQKRLSELQLLAGQSKVDYLRVPVNEPFTKLMLEFLQKRKKILSQ